MRKEERFCLTSPFDGAQSTQDKVYLGTLGYMSPEPKMEVTVPSDLSETLGFFIGQ